MPLWVGMVVFALFCAGLLTWYLAKEIRAFTRQAHSLGGCLNIGLQKINRMSDYFSPVRMIPCPKCGGSGAVEKENEVFHAVIELMKQGVEKKRGRR